MGVNFYATKGESEIHLGKSSHGWAFSVRLHSELGIGTFEKWKEFVASGVVITNSYGDRLTVDELMERVVNRRGPEVKRLPHGHTNWDSFLNENGADFGLHNLLFDRRAIERGDTWQCFDHEFS